MPAATFSKVTDEPLRIRRRSIQPLIDGGQSVQELGFVERKVIRYFWITNNALQKEIKTLESEVDEGWVIDGEPERVSIQPTLDLYNTTVVMRRLLPLK